MSLQVGVKAFIKDKENSYLFLKRRKIVDGEDEPDWTIPGGRIFDSETLDEGLSREIKEETGLILQGQPKIIFAQDIFWNNNNMHTVRLTFLVKTSGEITLDLTEHTEYQWLTIPELRKLNYDKYLNRILSLLDKSG